MLVFFAFVFVPNNPPTHKSVRETNHLEPGNVFLQAVDEKKCTIDVLLSQRERGGGDKNKTANIIIIIGDRFDLFKPSLLIARFPLFLGSFSSSSSSSCCFILKSGRMQTFHKDINIHGCCTAITTIPIPTTTTLLSHFRNHE